MEIGLPAILGGMIKFFRSLFSGHFVLAWLIFASNILISPKFTGRPPVFGADFHTGVVGETEFPAIPGDMVGYSGKHGLHQSTLARIAAPGYNSDPFLDAHAP